MLNTFSKKQLQVQTWWMPESPVHEKELIVGEGAIRSGKTLAMTDSFVNWSNYTFKNQNFIIAGVSIGALKRNILEPLMGLLRQKGMKYHYNETEKKLQIGSNTYYLFGGNNDYSQDSIQGLTAAGLLIDEAPLLPRNFIEQAMGRCSVSGSKYWFTLNPSSPFHWFKTEVIDKIDERNGLVLHFKMEDNPSITDDTIERYKRMFTGLFYKRYIEGLWVVAEGAVYDMFDTNKNVITASKNPDDYDEIIVGVDYGTSSVMTFALYGIQGEKVTLIKEYYWDAKQKNKQKTDKEYAADLVEFVEGWYPSYYYIDPSATSFRVSLNYVGVRNTRAAKNEVINGIRTVATKIKDGDFLIDKSCKDTLREIQNYSWDTKAQERGEDKPLKKNDHAMDRDRYAIHTYFSKPKNKTLPKPRGF